MVDFIETIRAAIEPGATNEARQLGITACRAVLGALEASPGKPINLAGSDLQPAPLASAIASLIRTTPPEQLLDLLVAKLSALIPADAKPSAPKMKIPYVRVPR
jgi:hypothetical protein